LLSRRKALKVVELKEILSKAAVTVTGKANKADLIAKILSSPEALAQFTGTSGAVPIASATPVTQPEPAGTSRMLSIHDLTNNPQDDVQPYTSTYCLKLN
jgi:hypothetical protein